MLEVLCHLAVIGLLGGLGALFYSGRGAFLIAG